MHIRQGSNCWQVDPCLTISDWTWLAWCCSMFQRIWRTLFNLHMFWPPNGFSYTIIVPFDQFRDFCECRCQDLKCSFTCKSCFTFLFGEWLRDLHPLSSPRNMSYFWFTDRTAECCTTAWAPMSLGCRTGEKLRWGKKSLGLGIVFSMAQWPFHGEKKRPVWDTQFDPWWMGHWNTPPDFQLPRTWDLERIWRTSIEKGDARHDGFPKKLRNSSLSLRSGLGWRCLKTTDTAATMESNCGGFRVLDSYVWAKGYRCSQIQDHITLWIKHMDEMDMAQNKTHK